MFRVKRQRNRNLLRVGWDGRYTKVENIWEGGSFGVGISGGGSGREEGKLVDPFDKA